jgi:hypothetical protein
MAGDLMEKKTICAILVLMMMLVLGCAVQQQAPEQVAAEQPAEDIPTEQPVEAEPATTKTTTTTKTTEPAEEQPAEEPSGYDFDSLPMDQQRKIKYVRKLMDEARAREENYFFRYSGPGVLQTDVWVKGDMMKRAMVRLDEVDIYHPYNMAYLDLATGKAEAYCETTKAQCPKGHGPATESFSKWKVKTPKDWLLELDNNFYWALDNKIDDVLYHIIDYRKDGKATRLYIRDYKGWPGRVEVHNTERPDSVSPSKTLVEQYVYDDMDVSGISDEDVTPQE